MKWVRRSKLQAVEADLAESRYVVKRVIAANKKFVEIQNRLSAQLEQEIDDRKALNDVTSTILEANSDLTTANALLRTALAHALSGREDEAWAILGEFQSTRW